MRNRHAVAIENNDWPVARKGGDGGIGVEVTLATCRTFLGRRCIHDSLFELSRGGA